jgi:hypothetical protein
MKAYFKLIEECPDFSERSRELSFFADGKRQTPLPGKSAGR